MDNRIEPMQGGESHTSYILLHKNPKLCTKTPRKALKTLLICKNTQKQGLPQVNFVHLRQPRLLYSYAHDVAVLRTNVHKIEMTAEADSVAQGTIKTQDLLAG